MNESKYFLTLKAARINVGLTQAELAEKIGVSALTVHSWENRKTKISTEKLIELCAVCHCRIDDVITWMTM